MWVIGSVIAAAGMWVYIVWGSVNNLPSQIVWKPPTNGSPQALPRNGGEKNYLEYLVRRPKYLITALYAANGVLLGWASGNSVVFGDYLLTAGNVADPGKHDWKPRLIGWAGLTFAFLLHGTKLQWGLRLLNILGVIKVIIVIIVIITGFVALGGHLKVPKPHNFSHAFDGTTASAPSFCLSLYNVSVA